VKKIGFLSFGHLDTVAPLAGPHAADSLRQSIELAVAAAALPPFGMRLDVPDLVLIAGVAWSRPPAMLLTEALSAFASLAMPLCAQHAGQKRTV